MKKRLLPLLCLLGMLSSLLGCTNRKTSIDYVIGVSLANLTEQWRLVLKSEIETQAEKYNNVRLVFTDAASSSDKQAGDLKRLMEYDIDLLIVSPWELEALTPAISEVYQAVPVIVLDRAVEGFDYTLFIGPDNQLIGQQAGEAVLQLLSGTGGRVLELRTNNFASKERSDTFVQTVSAQNAEVTPLLVMEGTRDCAEDTLMQSPEVLDGISVIFAHNDYMAYGARLALDALGYSDVRIVGLDGFDGENGGLQMVRNGQIDATITCPTGGREAVAYALDILNAVSGVPKQIILRSHSITADTVQAYMDTPSTPAPDRAEPIRVGHVQIGDEGGWRKANTESIRNAAREFGVDLTLADTEQSQEKQIEQVREFIREGMDVIVISPVVETGWDEVLQEAKDAGIPILLSDRKVSVPIDLYTAFIGADFIEQGRRCANWLLSQTDISAGPVRILEIQGTQGASPTVERKLGFEQKISENPNYQIVYSDYGDYNRDGGKRVIDTYLQEQPWGIDVIFAHNDDMALGAIESLRANGIEPGKDVLIISIDATSDALEALKKGELNCVAECSPLLGPQLMKAITDLMSGKELPLRIITDEIVFTQQTDKAAFQNRKY